MTCPKVSLIPQSRTDRNIVIDIDETCVHTVEEQDSKVLTEMFNSPKEKQLRERVYIIQFKSGSWMWGIKRNYLEEFIIFCFSYFSKVILWTAGQEEYAELMAKHICGKNKPYMLLSRKHCIEYGDSYIKPFSALESKENNITSDNTIMLDDNSFYMQMNKGNAIIIPRYQPDITMESLKQCDLALVMVMFWLQRKEVKNSGKIKELLQDWGESIFTCENTPSGCDKN